MQYLKSMHANELSDTESLSHIQNNSTKHRLQRVCHSDLKMSARPLAEPLLDQPDLPHNPPFSHGKDHHRYTVLPLCRSSSFQPTSPTSHHLKGCPSPGATWTPPDRHNLTGSKEQPGRAGSKGDLLEKRGRSRKEKGSVQHDWVLREMLSSREWFGTVHQSASSSSHVLLAFSCWLSVLEGKTVKALTKVISWAARLFAAAEFQLEYE